MKKILTYILMIVVAVTMLDLSTIGTYAAKKTCAHSGCDRGVDSGSYCRLHKCGKSGCNSEKGNNGTIYCDTHAREYVRKEGYTTCAASGCMCKATNGSYCYDHTCITKDCNRKRESGSNYCSIHGPKKTDSANSGTKKSTTSKSSSSTTKKSSSSSTTKKSSSSSTTKKSSSKSTTTKKKYDPYDVYSYKSAEEFADDKYEEFFDYEDDYEDDDDAHDAAIEYWKDHH